MSNLNVYASSTHTPRNNSQEPRVIDPGANTAAVEAFVRNPAVKKWTRHLASKFVLYELLPLLNFESRSVGYLVSPFERVL